MTQTTTAHTRGPIKPRHPEFDFSGLPRRWFAGLAFPTHLANGANLLFPLGERFFVKSVRHFEKAIADDPALREAVRGFYAQEGRHAQAHEQYFDTLRAQGFDIDTFLKIYRTLAFDGLARLTGPELNLAITAALEHYTATLAEGALRDRMLDAAHPVMRALLLWHSAEEIEHKSVAFDVLQRVNPSYALRMTGLAFATATLGGFWFAAMIMLLAQDGALHPGTLRAVREAEYRMGKPARSVPRDVFWAGLKAYARRDFHPSQIDNDGLASEFLREAAMA